MAKHAMRVRHAQHHDIGPIICLARRQIARLRGKYTNLYALEGHQLNESSWMGQRLEQQLPLKPLVAVDEENIPRGYVLPSLWTLPNQSTLHAFLAPRNGIASTLILPDPEEMDAYAVTEALLHALGTYWQVHETQANLIRWPSHDTWIRSILHESGFLIDSICALRTAPPSEAPPELDAACVIRDSLPSDEETIIALFQEELAYHEQLRLFARVSPIALAAFRAKLTSCWSREHQQDRDTFVLVAETGAGVVAMAECTYIPVTSDDEPGFTPPGNYGCLDNVCVSASVQGQGIGSAITQQALLRMQRWRPGGYLLWYSTGNPLSSHFWPKMGFTPLWTTYQSLH